MKAFFLPFTFVLVVAVTAMAAQEFSVDANTIALWHFNEGSGDTIFDAGNNNNHGVIHNGSWVTGKFGSSVCLKIKPQSGGSARLNDYIRIEYNPSLHMSGSFSVEFWFTTDSIISHYPFYTNHKCFQDNNGSFLIGGIADRIDFETSNPSGGWKYEITKIENIVHNQWHYYAFTYNIATHECKAYLNGTLVSDTIFTVNLRETGHYLLIGAMEPTTGGMVEPFGDSISQVSFDEFRVSNIARTASEIAATWQGTQNNLIAYYPFNGNANDESGYGNHGTVNGATLTTDRLGIANSAYSFDGVDDYIITVKKFSLMTGDAPRTMACWIYPEILSSFQHNPIFGWGIGFGSGTNSRTYSYLLVPDNGQIYFWGHNYDVKSPDSTITPGNWYHIAFVYTGSNESIYLNGNSVSPLTYLDTNFYLKSMVDYIRIGTEPAPWDHRFWKGKIDDIRIYNQALTSEEIQTLYQGSPVPEKPALIAIPSPSIERKPVFSWHHVQGATAYTIQIDTTALFTNLISSTPTTDSFFTPLLNLPIAAIYWRVASDLAPGLWSDVGVFTIQPATIPILIPYSPDPTLETKPTLQWHTVPGASSYNIMIDDNSDFSSVIAFTPVTDTQYSMLTDLPMGMIYWKVKSDLNTSYSGVDSFLIQSDSIPFLYSYDGAIVSTKRPEFKWKPVTGAIAYKLEIADNINFNTPLSSTPLSDTLYIPLADLNQGKMFWRVSCSRNLALFSAVDSLVIGGSVIYNGLNGQGKDIALSVFPNPFNSGTNINIYMPLKSKAELTVYSLNGKLVNTISAGLLNPGNHSFLWNGTGLNDDLLCSGVYLVRVRVENKVLQEKVLMLR
ncbi:MAG: LamG-like jellyroll fold domain-containing protein [bacterium]